MEKLLIATGNPGKLEDIKSVLGGLPIEIVGLKEFGLVNDVEETGATYEENALLKAKHFYKKINGAMPVLADDSGLVVDALADELGVYTRRWGAGHTVSDAEWLDYFIKRMEGVEDRKARFVSYAVLYESEESVQVFCAEAHGEIMKQMEAPIQNGLPLSSVFKPNGSDRVIAALTPEERAELGKRSFAAAKVRSYLEK